MKHYFNLFKRKKLRPAKVSSQMICSLLCSIFIFSSFHSASGQSISAAINWTKNIPKNGTTYFFHQNEYVRYDTDAFWPSTAPKSTQSGWNLPASWGGKVDAALNWKDNITYLFSGSEYVRYDIGKNRPSTPPKDTETGWNLPHSWHGKVDAAVNWGKGVTYLFSGKEYVRYLVGANKPDTEPKDIESGWNIPSSWGGKIDAAVNWGNGVTYLFREKSYVRYRIGSNQPDMLPANTRLGWNFTGFISLNDADVHFYDIHGSSARELRDQMNTNGPVFDGNRFDAVARWNFSWDWPGKGNPNECQLDQASITLNSSVTFPRWIPDRNASKTLVREWSSYLQSLILHEAGHVDHARLNKRNVVNAIRNATCETAENEIQVELNKIRTLDIEYDRRTRHGATQGAVFPKNN
ncbi:MAG: DUF922 domain-containing protein [Bacteroidota bacterium]